MKNLIKCFNKNKNIICICVRINIILMTLVLFSCNSQKKIIGLESKCFDIGVLNDNFEIFISKKERKSIISVNDDFKKYKIIYIVFDKSKKLYLVELFDKKNAYYCLQIDNNYLIKKEEKHYLDI